MRPVAALPCLSRRTTRRSRRGALRGLHSENWEKLVYVAHGEVFTAVADVRPESPTFGAVETFHLGESSRLKLFLPRSVAHGFCVLSDEADYMYQVTEYWDGSDAQGVAWDDPDLAVPWPISDPIRLRTRPAQPDDARPVPGAVRLTSRDNREVRPASAALLDRRYHSRFRSRKFSLPAGPRKRRSSRN